MIATGPGLACPRCGGAVSAVVDSRPGDGYIRRRRKCIAPECRERFSTSEMMVISSRGESDSFRPLRLQIALDKLPAHKRDLVLSLVAAFAADEVKTEGPINDQ